MARDVKTLEDEAMKLTAMQRAKLARHLLASLDDLDETEHEKLWVAESESRYQAYLAGDISARDPSEAIAEARKKL